MTKYKKQIEEMLDTHKSLFVEFKKVHDMYLSDPKKYQKAFDEEGEKVLPIIRRYENILCSKSEGGKYGKFSSNLADKYWSEIRQLFPKIDYVGYFE